MPWDVCEGIEAVYLEPLRDPRIGLSPGRSSRIARLADLLATGDDERGQVVRIVQEAHQQVEAHPLVQRTRDEIQQRLRGVAGKLMAQSAELRLASPEFRRIAQSLRARVGHRQYFEIEENGLGYNNLLYIATVLGELQRTKASDRDTDMAVLLVEEPEAHLHPHLQSILMAYLEDVSTREEPVQVFLTTHSPTLAAGASLDALNVLYVCADGQVMACPVSRCALTAEERLYLRRYLDVTKAQLFFSKGVLLVEGISEALLMPVFARQLGVDLAERGVSVVNVQSLAFEPFAKLFQEDGMRLPAAIITDADPPEDLFPHELDRDTLSPRAKRALEFEGGTLKVFLSSKTLEYDLALAGNAARMAAEYKAMRPAKGAEIEKAVASAPDARDKAIAVYNGMNPREKAVFAQRLAESLAQDWDDFHVPEYLQQALGYVTGVQV